MGKGGYLAKYKSGFRTRNYIALLFNTLICCTVYYILDNNTNLAPIIGLSVIFGLIIVSSLVFNVIVSSTLIKPTEFLANAIYHVSPNQNLVPAPSIKDVPFGRELLENLTRQIYDYSSVAGNFKLTDNQKRQNEPLVANDLADQLPVAIIGLNSDQKITFVNKTAKDLFHLTNPESFTLESQLKLKFANQTISQWLNENNDRNINVRKVWRKVDVSSQNNESRSYYDIAVVNRQKHSSGTDTILVFIDQDEAFQIEESTLNLVALSVHEIRTPLTILRGYIDVLKEELGDDITPSTNQIFDRIKASSEHLATFISNVLNVVKEDQNQLVLPLKESSWGEDLTDIVNDLQTRATIRDKKINLSIGQNIPPVAIDKASIHEVIANLLDNAIKYSPPSATNIWIDTKAEGDGSILTTIRDEGVGIPESVVPNLFSKFHRNHRNSRVITGTGLGLFISKAIISAHHGNIWVKSTEGNGTTVGFTLIPFNRLADILDKDSSSAGVSHGWIKNHSMQRR